MKPVSYVLLAANVVLLAIIVRLACQGPSPATIADSSTPAHDIAATCATNNDRQTLDSDSLQRRQLTSSDVLPANDGNRSAERATQAPLRALDKIVSIPIAFQGGDLYSGQLVLDQRQIEVINELRQKFRDDLANSSQDPTDPAYLKRWQEAQRENDNLLSGLLGGQFFLDYQIQAKEPAKP